MELWKHRWMGTSGKGRGRKSPATLAVAFLLSVAQVQTALAAITNTATATANYSGSGVASTPDAESVDVVTAAPAMVVTKTGGLNDDDGTPGLSAGDSVDYTVEIENTGNISLTGIGVSDPLVTLAYASGDLDSDNRIDPGETWVYGGSYLIVQSDIDTNGGGDGDIDNTATVSTDQLVDTDAAHELPISASPAISVAKAATLNDDDGTPGFSAGDTIDYTITVDNTGNTTITNVVVTDPLVALSLDGGDTNSDTDLNTNETWTYTGTYTVVQNDIDTNGGGDGLIENTVTVATDETPDGTASADISVLQVPAIAVAKTGTLNDDDGTPGLSAGDTIDYSITVENTGNQTITGVSLDDPLIALALSGGDANSNSDLDIGETWSYSGSYTILQSDIDNNGGGDGDIDNTVTVSTNETIDRIASHAIALSVAPSLTISKTGTLNDDDGTSGLSDGDTVSYTIEVENTGNQTLTGVVLSDSLNQSGNITTLPVGAITGDSDSDNELDVGETWSWSLAYTITQANIDDGGDLLNTASVVTDQVALTDATDTQVLSAAGFVRSYTMTKTAILNDGDSDGLGDLGETITYQFSFTNTGNQTLTNLAYTDPLPGLGGPVCVADADSDGDIDSLAPLATAQCEANYTITQADIDAGSLTNTATSSATGPAGLLAVVEDDAVNDNSVTVDMDSRSELAVSKTGVAPVQQFATLYTFDYTIEVENTGTTQIDTISIVDDLAAAVAPGTISGVPTVTWSGFAGTGSLNAGFDGDTDTALVSGDVQLAPGDAGEVQIVFTVDTGGASLNTLNTAIVDAAQLSTPVQSDDPSLTPGDPSDTNPTPVIVVDSDGDGSPDSKESPTADRDGDGVADADDYDPTGYFYCEADGRILSGGLISVENLTSGGSQTGIGSSNGIVIVQDGASGFYQFHVTQPGDFEMTYTLPTGGVASTTLTSLGTLDATSLLPSDPAVLGSGEVGATGFLADAAPVSNPFYTQFTFEAGDPIIFNNNIPLALCSTPELTSSKTIASGPALQADGSSTLVYELVMENTGAERVENVQVSDDLDAAFGAGNYDVNSYTVSAQPAGFTATENPFYDGSGNIALLTNGGTLEAGESVTILLDLTVRAGTGTYTNTMVATGTAPLDGSAITPANSSVDVPVTTPASGSGLVVSKVANTGFALKGQPVGYTITVRNTTGVAITGFDVVDQLPAGFTYLAGSATVDGTADEPDVNGKSLIWRGLTIAPSGTIEIGLVASVGAAASGTEFINYAFAADPVTGERLSNLAEARVQLEIEAVFDCGQVIGRVFEDINRNGVHDEGEPGIGGVRLATVNGELITTDRFGRYSVPCPMIPDEDIGSNFILKLDERTLPDGFSVTSENPRVVRLTRGKLVKLNFGSASARVISIDLDSRSFVSGEARLREEAVALLSRTLVILEEEETILRITFDQLAGGEVGGDELARERLALVEQLLERAWDAKARPYELRIIKRRIN